MKRKLKRGAGVRRMTRAGFSSKWSEYTTSVINFRKMPPHLQDAVGRVPGGRICTATSPLEIVYRGRSWAELDRQIESARADAMEHLDANNTTSGDTMEQFNTASCDD